MSTSNMKKKFNVNLHLFRIYFQFQHFKSNPMSRNTKKIWQIFYPLKIVPPLNKL